MRIIYHHRTQATDAQGVHIAEMISAFRQLGHEVYELALVRSSDAAGASAGQSPRSFWSTVVRRLPVPGDVPKLAFNLVGLPRLIWRAFSFRADFIYERYSLYNFCGVIAGSLLRLPVVVEVNSPLAIEEHREQAIRWRRLARATERWICNRATRVLVVSGPLRNILVEEGVAPERIVVIPNGVNPAQFRSAPKPAAKLDSLRLSTGLGERILIGFVGWFRPWHGLDLLLRAFVDGGLKDRGAALLLVGDGPAAAQIRALVEEHSLHDCVTITGAVPHQQVPDYVSLMDIAVQPSANEYCCPVKILEYMALGKPIVAPRQANIVELLTDGEDAVLFTPGDTGALAGALQRLVTQPGFRRRIGSTAARAIESRGLSWTRNASAVLRMVQGPA